MTLSPQRMHANEQDIQKRLLELERSLGSLLPPTTSSGRIEQIIREAEEQSVRSSTLEMNEAMDRNPVLEKPKKRKASMFV